MHLRFFSGSFNKSVKNIHHWRPKGKDWGTISLTHIEEEDKNRTPNTFSTNFNVPCDYFHPLLLSHVMSMFASVNELILLGRVWTRLQRSKTNGENKLTFTLLVRYTRSSCDTVRESQPWYGAGNDSGGDAMTMVRFMGANVELMRASDSRTVGDRVMNPTILQPTRSAVDGEHRMTTPSPYSAPCFGVDNRRSGYHPSRRMMAHLPKKINAISDPLFYIAIQTVLCTRQWSHNGGGCKLNPCKLRQ